MKPETVKDADLTVRNAQIAAACLEKGGTCGEIDVNKVAILALKYYIKQHK